MMDLITRYRFDNAIRAADLATLPEDKRARANGHIRDARDDLLRCPQAADAILADLAAALAGLREEEG